MSDKSENGEFLVRIIKSLIYTYSSNTNRNSFKKLVVPFNRADNMAKITVVTSTQCNELHAYRGVDKSLARPGRKQAAATEDFDVHISYL
jgi:hypothetical protein